MALDSDDENNDPPKKESIGRSAPTIWQGIGRIPRLNAAETEAYKELGPYSVTIGGSLGPEPAFIGDQEGKRPVRLGGSGSWSDSVTATLDAASPFQRRELLARIWFEKRETAKRFLTELPRHLDTVSTSSRAEWRVLADGIDLDELVIGLEDFAKSLGLRTFDDPAILVLVRERAAAAKST